MRDTNREGLESPDNLGASPGLDLADSVRADLDSRRNMGGFYYIGPAILLTFSVLLALLLTGVI